MLGVPLLSACDSEPDALKNENNIGSTMEDSESTPNTPIDSDVSEYEDDTGRTPTSPDIYSISYALGGAPSVPENPSSYTEDDEITLVAPTKTGYTFAGWTYDGQPDPKQNVVVPKGSTGNKAFTANWTPIVYTITLDTNGGETLVPLAIEYHAAYTLPLPTWEGHTFSGWFCEGIKYESGIWNDASDMTLVARWDTVVYSITYDLGGGSHGNTNAYTYDQVLSLQAPTKTGYDFIGWTYEGQAVPQTEVTIPKGSSGDRHFVAHWTPTTYRITFDPNGGKPLDSMAVDYYGTYELPTPTWDGHEFVGWFDGDQKYSHGQWTQPNGLHLVAKWDTVVYEITYETDGGTHENPNTYTYNDSFSLHVPTRLGYDFVGWTYEGQNEPQMEVILTQGSFGDKTYVAHWTPSRYTITFDTQGAGEIGDQAVTYLGHYTLPTPRWEGHTFSGWFDGNTQYASGIWEHPNDVRLVAKWDVLTYEITYASTDYCESNPNPNTYTYDDEITLVAPTMTGFTFLGWTNAGQNQPQLSVTIPKGSTGNKHFTAHWERKRYTIRLDTNGGEPLEDYTVEYASPVNLPNPVKAGYFFAGWYDENGNLVDSHIDQWLYEGGASLTAKWTVENYHIYYYLNGGSTSNPTTYTCEQEVVLTAPVRDGYDFLGWTLDDQTEPQKSLTIPKGTTGTLYLTAHWTYATYTVTFDTDGGEPLADMSVVYYSDYELPTPKKTGYSFVGWTLDGQPISSTGYWYDTKGASLKATWTINQYNVHISHNYAAGEIEGDGYHTYQTDATLSVSKVYRGYSFVGWYEGDTLLSAAPTYTFTMDAKIYDITAVWEKVDEMKPFVFTADETSVTITGVVDKTVTELYIPDYVVDIAWNALGGCEALDTMITPTVFPNINYDVKERIKNLTIYGNVAITSEALDGYSSLTNLVLGDAVTAITDYALRDLRSLSSVTIGKGVTEIGTYVFFDSPNLSYLTVSEENPIYRSVDHCLIVKDSGVLLYGAANSVIPEDGSVTEISAYAFYQNALLKRIAIPASITKIGLGAFYRCTALEEVIFKATACEKAKAAFNQVGNAETDLKVVIAANVTQIPAYLFSDDYGHGAFVSSIEFEPGSVCESIGASAFDGAQHLTELTIPDSVKSIGRRAFYDCSAVRSLSIGKGLASMESIAFYMPNLEELYFNAVELGNGNEMFLGALSTGLDIVIGKDVESIPAYMFYEESGNITSITFEEGSVCKTIGEYAFATTEGFLKLESLTFPDRLEMIGDYAFAGLNIKSLSIEKNIRSIGSSAFGSCPALCELYYNAPDCSASYWDFMDLGADGNGIALTVGASMTTVPSGLFSHLKITSVTFENGSLCKNIATRAFYDCEYLTRIILPDSLETIEDYAFEDCTRLSYVEFGKGLLNIGNCAFADCAELVTITLPDSLTAIGSSAFRGCVSLTSLTLPFTGQGMGEDATNQKLGYLFSGFSDDYPKNLTQVTVTKHIGTNAFDGFAGLFEITLGSDITSIPESAFEGLSSLKRVTFVGAVESVGNRAFKDCVSLSSFPFTDALLSIGESAFSGCQLFTELSLPESVTEIGSYAFEGCINLQKATVPDSVGENYGVAIFADCFFLSELTVPYLREFYDLVGSSGFRTSVFEKLTITQTLCEEAFRFVNNAPNTVVLGVGVTQIPERAFERSDVKKVEILSTDMTSIGANAFENCDLMESFVMPDSVVEIGEYAFYGCDTLRSVELSTGVTELTSHVFGYCFSLSDIELHEGILSIGYGSLYGTNLTELTIPDSVEVIGTWAFAHSALQSISFGDGVTSLGDLALAYCKNLTSVEIPNGIQVIPNQLFYRTPLKKLTIPASVSSILLSALPASLVEIKVDAANPYYRVAGNCLIETETKTLIRGFDHSVIPNDGSVTAIAAYAFEDCTGLTDITIPNSVTTIGDYAFSGCTDLTSVYIPRSVTSVGDYCFMNCTSLKSLTISSYAKNLRGTIIYGCRALEEIEETDPSVGAVDGTSLFTVMDNCVIGLDIEGQLVLIMGCKNSVIPSGVDVIGQMAFYGSDIEQIDIPASVSRIYPYAFAECHKLSSLTLSEGLEEIDSAAFLNCVSLTSVDLPDSLIKMYSAFQGCTGLTEITIPKNVTVASHSFDGCSNLKKLYFNAVAYTGSSMLDSWESDGVGVDVVIGADVPSIPAELFKNSRITSLSFEGGSKCTSIGADAFKSCTRLVDVALPDGLLTIGYQAFDACISLSSVVIPDTVTTVGERAFSDCTSLVRVVIGRQVSSLIQDAFYRCTSLREVYDRSALGLTSDFFLYSDVMVYRDDSTLISTDENGFMFLNTPDGVELIGYVGASKNIVFPEHVNGKSYKIGDYAFYQRSDILSITLSEGITEIGAYAFAECTALAALHIPASVSVIGDNAFMTCTGLNAITVDADNESYHALGNSLIETATETLILGSNASVLVKDDPIKIIAQNAFQKLDGLLAITIPDSVTVIEESAFFGCKNLAALYTSNDSMLTTIEHQAFYACEALKTVVIPDSLTSVAGYAFDDTPHKNIFLFSTDGWKYVGSSGVLYFYSEIEKDGCWHYMDGLPTTW